MFILVRQSFHHCRRICQTGGYRRSTFTALWRRSLICIKFCFSEISNVPKCRNLRVYIGSGVSVLICVYLITAASVLCIGTEYVYLGIAIMGMGVMGCICCALFLYSYRYIFVHGIACQCLRACYFPVVSNRCIEIGFAWYNPFFAARNLASCQWETITHSLKRTSHRILNLMQRYIRSSRVGLVQLPVSVNIDHQTHQIFIWKISV